MPIHGESSGCTTFLSKCAKSLVVGLVVGFVGFVVGGNEMVGCFVALFATPAGFLGAMVYFTSRPDSSRSTPPPRKLPDFKKRPAQP